MGDTVYLTVKYSCEVCKIKKREVRVPARGDEDVVTWLESTCTPTIALDHAKTSLGCPAQAFDLMVPFLGADKIGGVIKQ